MEDDPKDPTEDLLQAERIEKLKERIDEVTGGKMSFSENGEMPPDLEEQFLENVAAIEEAGWSRPADHLKEGGLQLVPADELDDEAVSEKLRELIHAMALRQMYVMHTDHLSDRELYAHLLESLQEESFLGPAKPVKGFHFGMDVLGSYGDEEMYLYNKYYASDESRESWLRDWPDDEMPAREKPPYDRDRFLPQPEPPQAFSESDLPEGFEMPEGFELPDDDEPVM